MLDTKSNRRNKIAGVLVSFLLLGLLAALAVGTYPLMKDKLPYWDQRYEEHALGYRESMYQSQAMNLVKNVLKCNYGLYWRMAQKEQKQPLTPSQVYLPDYLRTSEEKSEYESREEEYQQESIEGIHQINRAVEDWFQQAVGQEESFYGLRYYAVSTKDPDIFFSNTKEEIPVWNGEENSRDIEERYDFYLLCQYDGEGKFSIPYLVIKGISVPMDDIIYQESKKDQFFDYLDTESQNRFYSQIQSPENYQAVFAGNWQDIQQNGSYYSSDFIKETWSLAQSGIVLVFGVGILLAFLAAIFLPFVKLFGMKEGGLSCFPLEFTGIGAGIAMVMCSPMTEMINSTLRGRYADFSQDYYSKPVEKLLVYGSNWLAWSFLFLLVFLFGLTVRQLFTMGPKRFFVKRTITGRFLSFLVGKLKAFLHGLKEIDFSEDTTKTILKVVFINFAIVGILCCFWIFGAFGLMIYSIILFILLKKYADDVKRKYNTLLNAVNKMAEGNLNVPIEENLGIFEPLKQEFCKVQTGFKKAVEEETKSQMMKTELVTNVSHDLKTPLTAIITYVNLLKDETITAEERKSYIDTLDKKSLRLKQLIEDLFEVSKATSNNVTLNLVDVELGALIKQAGLELEDKIQESGIEFRYQLPEEKVVLKLDSDKTYRMIENLMVNIIKYGLPGSRAYIELKMMDGKAEASFKNISATELDFNTEEITERFVRGDKARSSDGSGLGLAIVKSFAQVQGGSFQVVTDGDLFKAILVFPQNEPL